jgi:D-arabinose 1-dehydrogenase-like Zn-dependent alcohol dehydrogenase
LKEIPMPELRPGDVLIKVAYVGVCQSDLDIYDGKIEDHKQGRARYPIVPGHEFSGEVARVGANINHLQVGDKVVGEASLSCGTCEFCMSGVNTACNKRTALGVEGLNGAYARFLTLPAKHVHQIPPDIDLATACLAEPLAAVHRGIQSIGHYLRNGSSKCAVLGGGDIGHLCTQALGLLGHTVLPLDAAEDGLKLGDGSMETHTNMDGVGQFHLVVETTGQSRHLRHLLNESRAGSTILLLGSGYGTMDYNFTNLVSEDRVLVGSVGAGSEDFAWAIKTLPGIDTAPFTQSIVPLEKFDEAWSLHRSGKHLKVILKVD